VVQRGRQQLDGLGALLAGLLGDAVERAVEDALCDGLLAVLHDHVHELGQHLAVVLRVRKDGAGGCCGTTGHGLSTFWKTVTSSDAWRRTWNGPACGR